MPKYDSIDHLRLRKIKKEFARLGTMRLTLQEFISRAALIDPLVEAALEGIYCGTSGRVHEQLGGTRYWILFTWYTDPNSGNPPIVETAYVS